MWRDLKACKYCFFYRCLWWLVSCRHVPFTLSMSKHSQLNIEQPLELAVLGAEHFPELIHALEENAIKITTDKNNSANPEEPPYSLEIPANAVTNMRWDQHRYQQFMTAVKSRSGRTQPNSPSSVGDLINAWDNCGC